MIYTNIKINDRLQQVIIVTNIEFGDLKIDKEIFKELNNDLKIIANLLTLHIRFNGKEVEDVRRLVFNYSSLLCPINDPSLTSYSFVPDYVQFI
ncbi:hypothetical protein [Clostridium magnum]|uniref:Uncharacterized protein n=1 Tax=Clostridium magnum DSM 2767 TaxID=1121326 RepID=A0A161WZ61_9CLOT|nr:hypothetical protein [Clostridium magnum]KZL92418.1 hypothetical protein CLMAG_22270 [Clostridium magnum DSM 2767]SHH10139.1 hypothetical protein SAMN02745944_00001 [Clostridium magnum DSM 2767]